MTFADMHDVVHRAASAKGGRMRVKKGFATNKELAKIAGSKGGKAKHANRGREDRKEEEDTRGNNGFLERVLGDIDDNDNV